ncbi:Metalloprotease LoiP precursor [Pseudodesulfovibrio hydrargyri]|uniref:Metalloprotease LoiP n=1 Tax=Pseudodesulfovibrio hydrargyri TaxID=2125990 RepID=A0A1J5MSN4_9BACT|nr:M48 family metallopeptidase [Pseudodesulfovibrio hydrargyri]OIQ49630.1 Metalloprotease LoiP precursor [Pseudodesulfovibrio hydrargyri]
MLRTLPLIILVLILSFGCKTPELTNPKSWVGMDEPDTPFIDQFRNPAPEPCEADPETGPATVAAKAPDVEEGAPAPTIAIPEKALAGQRLTIGVARNEAIEAYLNSVLEKLQRAWPGEPVPSYVFLRPSPEFGSFAADHAVFVDYGLLRTLESEDEVAALLAHEYSHVLLGHQSLQSWSSLLGVAVDLYQTTASVKYRTSGDQDNLLKDAALSIAADKLGQNALIPVFSRDNEEDADSLGTDLLILSGYSPMGMVNLLQRVADWEDRQEQLKEEIRKAEEEARKAAKDGKDELSMDKLFADLGKATNKIGRKHYAAKDRESAVKQYVRTHYAGRPRNALLTEPYQAVFGSGKVAQYFNGLDDMDNAKLAAISGKPKDALALIRGKRCRTLIQDVPYVRYLDRDIAARNKKLKLKTLEADCQRDDTLLLEYRLLMIQYEAKAPKEALAVADTAYASLDKPELLLPDLIRLNKKLGNESQSLGYLVTCKGSGDSGLISSCQENLNTEKEQ